MRKVLLLIVASLSVSSLSLAEIPACLNSVVNKVDVCKEEIENTLKVAETTVNKSKQENEKIHYGEILSFPTMVDGQQAVLSLAKTNKGLTQVILFKAELGYGLFWKKSCSLSFISSTSIPEGFEKDYLSNTFKCN
jgi:hypothetical protein